MDSFDKVDKKCVIAAAVGVVAGVVGLRLLQRSRKYHKPEVWAPSENGGKFSKINSHTAGARTNKALPVGEHKLQLYSLRTPNGVKTAICLEEMVETDPNFEYDAYTINIFKGDQFTSGFVGVNPNSKIPALVDRSTNPPTRVFESGAILLYLADKYPEKNLIPKDSAKRAECISWLMWQMGNGAHVGGGFGHFFAYAPFEIEYAIDRYAMEVKRQLDVLDQQLAASTYVAGEDYSIADIAIWPWYGAMVLGRSYKNSEKFLQVAEYKNVVRWAKLIDQRPAARRARKMTSTQPGNLAERHHRSDFDSIDLDADT